MNNTNQDQEINWLKAEIFLKGPILNRTTLMELMNKYNAEIRHNHNELNLNGIKRLLTSKYTLLKEIRILHKSNVVIRYIPTYLSVSPLEISLSIAGKKAYLSHLSALYMHGLTDLNPTEIYINEEQSPKPINKKNAVLTQEKVDKAFAKPVRTTSNKATFIHNNVSYSVTILNGKNTNYLGVTSLENSKTSSRVRVSSIERSLIEATVRPNYSGGVKQVLESFERAENLISILKLTRLMDRFSYIYPYGQSLLFYAKFAGYSVEKLTNISKISPDKHINFYLDHQIINPKLEEESKVFYPGDLDY